MVYFYEAVFLEFGVRTTARDPLLAVITHLIYSSLLCVTCYSTICVNGMHQMYYDFASSSSYFLLVRIRKRCRVASFATYEGGVCFCELNVVLYTISLVFGQTVTRIIVLSGKGGRFLRTGTTIGRIGATSIRFSTCTFSQDMSVVLFTISGFGERRVFKHDAFLRSDVSTTGFCVRAIRTHLTGLVIFYREAVNMGRTVINYGSSVNDAGLVSGSASGVFGFLCNVFTYQRCNAV